MYEQLGEMLRVTFTTRVSRTTQSAQHNAMFICLTMICHKALVADTIRQASGSDPGRNE